MPRQKKVKFTPRPKKTLTPQPKWDKLSKAKTEEERMIAWNKCEEFVHNEVTEREYVRSLKMWIRNKSDWNVDDKLLVIPETFLMSTAKNGWKAIKLGFMPNTVEKSLKGILLPLLDKADELKLKTLGEPLIHPSVLEKDEDHPLHVSKVREWITATKDYLKSSKHYEDSSDAKQRMLYQKANTYLYNLSTYLRTGVWLDSRYGEKREFKQVSVCVAPAFNKDGTMKRTIGFYYPDIDRVWKKDMELNI